MFVAWNNAHRIPYGFDESSLVCGLEALPPGVLKRPA
jgi:hypothetical protein